MVDKIKKQLKNVIIFFFSMFPINNIILFESNSEIKDSSKALFEECINQEINKRYKMIWFVEDTAKYKNSIYNLNNVRFIKKSKSNSHSVLFLYYCCVAKYCFYTHIFLGLRKTKGQVKVFLTHGIPIKDTRGLFWNPYDNTDIISTSESASDLRCKTFGGGKDIVRILGFPRNDKLFMTDTGTEEYLKKIRYSKLILWLPTSKHFNIEKINRNDFACNCDNDITIMSEKFLEELNIFLHKNDEVLFIKFHPGQDLNYIKLFNFSNIIMMSNDELENNNIDLYSLMARSSALITDFSSVYIDYLLLNKPIGFELMDFENFKNGRGFLMENPLELMPGEKITNEQEFLKFIVNATNDNDLFKKQRAELMENMHKYKDGNSSKRIIEYFKLNSN